MSDFDERSGVVYCKTPWGQWGQTIDEVFVEVDVAASSSSSSSSSSVRAKDIKCEIRPNAIAVSVRGQDTFKVLWGRREELLFFYNRNIRESCLAL